MGCTYDVINAKVKNMDDAKKFIDFFNNFFKDDLYFQDYEIDESFITENEETNELWINIDEEPLFRMMSGEESIELFVENFSKKHPKLSYYLNYICTYNNCSDAFYMEVNYDGDNKIKLRKVWADDEGIFMCPKCEEDFEEALCYIDDFEEDKVYTCPFCGADIEYQVEIEESEINILES